MKTCDHPLYLERVDAARNMARFYLLVVEPDLFGSFIATRRWGRIGATGREKVAAFASEDLALAEVARHARVKRRRGYVERG
jgi:predicted DNA-binding WGR domain protein